MRSFVAVGSGDRVGPTGRPIMIMAPLRDEGYCSLKTRQRREILYWHSRANGQSLATSAAKYLLQRFGAIAPDDENEPQAPIGYDASKCSTPMMMAKPGRILSATREISRNFSLNVAYFQMSDLPTARKHLQATYNKLVLKFGKLAKVTIC